jgi:hypothetical protein
MKGQNKNMRNVIWSVLVLGISVGLVMGYPRGTVRYMGNFTRTDNNNQLDPVYSGSPVYNGQRPTNFGSVRSSPVGLQGIPQSMNISGGGYQRTAPGGPQLPYGFQNPTLQQQTYGSPQYTYRPISTLAQPGTPRKLPGIIIPVVKDDRDISPETLTVLDPEREPFEILQRMSDYVGGLVNFRLGEQDTYEEVLVSGEKVQLSSWRSFQISRPDKMISDIQGDMANQRVWYDGKTITLLDRTKNVYGIVKAPGNIDAMVEMAVNTYHISASFMDLLGSDFYGGIRDLLQDGDYVGLHKVGDYDCHHLAFRLTNVDWEIWIQAGDKPLPRKFVVTYKNRTGKPRFSAQLPYWELDVKFPADNFQFVPPAGARETAKLPLMTTEDRERAGEAVLDREGNRR